MAPSVASNVDGEDPEAVARAVMAQIAPYTQHVSLLCDQYFALISATGIPAIQRADAERLAKELALSPGGAAAPHNTLTDLGDLTGESAVSSDHWELLQHHPSEPASEPLMSYSRSHESAAGTIGVAMVQRGFKAALHHHSEPEIYVFIEGSGLLYLSGRIHRISAPAVMKIPGDAVHCMTPITDRVVLGYGFGVPINQVKYYFLPKYLALSPQSRL